MIGQMSFKVTDAVTLRQSNFIVNRDCCDNKHLQDRQSLSRQAPSIHTLAEISSFTSFRGVSFDFLWELQNGG